MPPKDNLKTILPLIPLKEVVIFPRLSIPLAIGEAKSLKAIEFAMTNGSLAFFVSTKESPPAEIGPGDIYQVGVAAKIVEVVKQPDGIARVLIEGLRRARIAEVLVEDPFIKIKVDYLKDLEAIKNEKVEALMYTVVNEFKEAVNLGATVPFDVMLVIMNLTDPVQLADLVTVNMDFRATEKQAILESETSQEKLEKVSQALGRQIKVLRLSRKMQTETTKEISKMEKEMLLREQLKAIEKELGVVSGKSETMELRDKIEQAGMTDEVKEAALHELARMEGMPSFSPEISYIRTYLDWLIALPWSKKSESKVDLKKSKQILDEDHWGLEKVKERVLEYLAVHKLVGKVRGPILCFSGPPGTGKTSIGRSIAKSLGRQFVRMSLGGVRDEAEIRGHRRTYVGAMPGRIINAIKQAGTRNPVIMLDEIDKLGADQMHGDPSSALLEALDPEQNFSFRDHYLEVPFDLSDVMFITTANYLETIPPALRDRMEVIEYSGYIEDEKYHIADKYLVPKSLTNNGLDPKEVTYTEGALRRIIREYTMEAGVRELERKISQVGRKIAKIVATGDSKKKKYTVEPKELEKYLGLPRYHHLEAEKKSDVGVVTGLAWTEAGGDILFIEATKMPGRGNLMLTGQLGKVMQESAQAAHAFVRTNAKALGIKDDFYKNTDIHIHVPAGGIPKDGPSAGVAMITALVSTLSGKKVRHTIGMTGEISLHGKVMPIGGVREKILAAHRAGIRTVLLPKENEKDLEDVPEDVRKQMKILLMENASEVLRQVLIK